MGRIFSWKEIVEGKVPTILDFDIVSGTTRDRLTENDRVIGGLFLGSVLRGDFTNRSDVDVLVVYKEDLFYELAELISLAKKHCVPLQIIPLEIEIAKRGIHTLNEGNFLSHLEWAARNGGIIKENPLRFIKSTRNRPEIVLRNTFKVISTNVAKSIGELYFYEGEKKMILLAKLLEAPMHIVRQIVWYKGKENPEESEEKAIQFYLETVEDPLLTQLLREILSLDERYSEILEEILSKDSKGCYKRRYNDFLHRIENTCPKILIFVERNALLFTK